MPLRVELGPREVESKTCVVARRDRPGGVSCLCVCARLCVEVDSRDVESKTCVVAQRDRPGGLMCVRVCVCARGCV